MKLCFLYPGSHPYDSVDHWVRALGRFAPRDEVILSRSLDDCLAHQPDVALAITEATCHPGKDIDHELVVLMERKIPCGVLWNNDVNGPTPGAYPSFVWTQRSCDNLKKAYQPALRRQPVFPPVVECAPLAPICVGTFGVIDAKKQIAHMRRWAERNELPFRVFGPDLPIGATGGYVEYLRCSHPATMVVHPWLPYVEHLAPLLKDVSHFLFVLPPSKGGTGGSPTSPRYAGLFNRPVIVVDDEQTFAQDRYYVYPMLDMIPAADLPGMQPPAYTWSPERYVEAIVEDTLKWWWGKTERPWWE